MNNNMIEFRLGQDAVRYGFCCLLNSRDEAGIVEAGEKQE